MLKLAALATAGLYESMMFLGEVLGSPNALLNLFTIALIVAAAAPTIRSRRKDAIIKDLETALHAKDERLVEIQEDLIGAEKRADMAQERAHGAEKREAALKAQYDEMQKYTAQPAFEELREAIKALIAQQSATDVRMKQRHQDTIDLIRMLAGEKSVTDDPRVK